MEKCEYFKRLERWIEEADRYNQLEKERVRSLVNDIGFGKLMRLAEQIWDEKKAGEAHSVGCCTCFLVECQHPEVEENNPHCDWCCGSGRVTKRVAQEIEEKFKKVTENETS